MESNDSNAPRKVVPITFEYVSFADGDYQNVSEKRHIYYTMGSVAQMMEKFGVSQDRAREIAQNAEGEDEAVEELENMIAETETGMTEEEGMIVMLWAGLLAEANSKGEDLTVQEVGNMWDLDRMDEITSAIREAWAYFDQGEVTQENTPTPTNGEQDTAGKATAGAQENGPR